MRMRRKISIRMSKEDVEELESLEKKGWTKSRAIRFLLKKYGKILAKAKVSDLETMETFVGFPEKCPKCGGRLTVRAPHDVFKLHFNTLDQLWECDDCRALYRAIYSPTEFRPLEEK